MRNAYENQYDIRQGITGQINTLTLSAGQIAPAQGEIDAVLCRLHGLLGRAQSVAGQMEETSTRLMGAMPTGIGKNEDKTPEPVSTVAKLHAVCGWLEANMEHIGESAQRLSRL